MPMLAEMFSVSVRTIVRDIDELSLMIPIINKAGRYGGGVRVIDSYTWDKSYMSREDILLLKKIKEVAVENKEILKNDEILRLDRIIKTYTQPNKMDICLHS